MPKPSNIYPRRGEIYVADLNPFFGREIHKKRPVLIISHNIINQNFPTVIMLPLSSIVPQFIGQDVVKLFKFKGLGKDSVILITQIRSIDKTRLIKKVGKISTEKLEEVEEALKLILGMTPLEDQI